jgi:hypothetical protein
LIDDGSIGMPMGDFPNLERFRESLKKFDIKKFPKLEKKRVCD